MGSMPTELFRYTLLLARALGERPVGSCATASVVLWRLWHAITGERLVFCVAFEENVAHHVFLRRERLLVDPTGHQFESHQMHCHEPENAAQRMEHHRCTVDTSDMREFHELLRSVGWPEHQWPSPERVLRMTRKLLEQAALHPVPVQG